MKKIEIDAERARESLVSLVQAIEKAEATKRCITESRGYDKEQAREGFECCVAFEVFPAIQAALDECWGDVPGEAVVRIARKIAEEFAKN